MAVDRTEVYLHKDGEGHVTIGGIPATRMEVVKRTGAWLVCHVVGKQTGNGKAQDYHAAMYILFHIIDEIDEAYLATYQFDFAPKRNSKPGSRSGPRVSVTPIRRTAAAKGQ